MENVLGKSLWTTVVQWSILRLLLAVFIILVLAWCVTGCAVGEVVAQDDPVRPGDAGRGCVVSEVRYPTTEEEFHYIYAGRDFLAAGNHLGRDLDLPEGMPVHPIACGTVKIYRPAQGYGTLVVVVEHEFRRPLSVVNGVGARVTLTHALTIYGHLRRTPELDGADALPWHAGDVVQPDDVIGYIQNDALNGDGAEHLHLGVRLQNQVEAERVDTNWFRGYDTSPSQRRWFADPEIFMRALLGSSAPVGTDAGRAFESDAFAPTDSATLVTADIGVRTLSADVGTDAGFGTSSLDAGISTSMDAPLLGADGSPSFLGDASVPPVDQPAHDTSSSESPEPVVEDALDVSSDAGRMTDPMAGSVDAGDPPAFARVQYPSSASCDGRRLDLPDRPGMTWYHVCVTTPRFGADSTHPWSLERPEAVQFSQVWDATLPEYSSILAAPSGTGQWLANVAWATLNAPVAYAMFNARYQYSGGRLLYGIGENREGGPVEFNGTLWVYQVVGGRQNLVATEIVGAASCRPVEGGSAHVPGTGCPPSACHSAPLACTP